MEIDTNYEEVMARIKERAENHLTALITNAAQDELDEARSSVGKNSGGKYVGLSDDQIIPHMFGSFGKREATLKGVSSHDGYNEFGSHPGGGYTPDNHWGLEDTSVLEDRLKKSIDRTKF